MGCQRSLRGMTTSHPHSKRYRKTNWKEYNAALRRRGSLTLWLDKDMAWYSRPNGKNGRPETSSDAAIQFCLVLRSLLACRCASAAALSPVCLKLAETGACAVDFARRQHADTQRCDTRMQAVGPSGLESRERIPSPKSGGNHDASSVWVSASWPVRLSGRWSSCM